MYLQVVVQIGRSVEKGNPVLFGGWYSPLVAANLEDSAPQLSFANLRKVFNSPSKLSVEF